MSNETILLPNFVTGTGYDPMDGAVQFRHMGRERLDYLIKSLILYKGAKAI